VGGKLSLAVYLFPSNSHLLNTWTLSKR